MIRKPCAAGCEGRNCAVWRLCKVDVTPRLKVVKTTQPAGRTTGVKVGSVEKLIATLRDQAGVL